MKDKDLFRRTEGILYSYNDLLNDIDLVREDIKILEEEYKGSQEYNMVKKEVQLINL